MVAIRLFASAREAAGVGTDDIPGVTVGEVLDAAADRYGEAFVAELAQCRVWRNGEPAERADAVASTDEVAVLPPVSGGC
jgi:molybdopterin synthase sulfur carrier subunit